MSEGPRESSFDNLAKGLASGTVSRRQVLRLMGGALVGAALTSIPGVAWAKPKPGKCTKDKHCPTGQRCVDGVCQEECVADEVTCSVPESSSGCQCVTNACTRTLNCVCCPPGGPCPCLEVDPADPCIVQHSFTCPENPTEPTAVCGAEFCFPEVT